MPNALSALKSPLGVLSLAARLLPIPVLGAFVVIIGVCTHGVSQSPLPDADEHNVSGVNGVVAAPIDPLAACKVGSAGDMIGFSHSDASGTQTITLVHAGKSWMAVYHIDRSGTIRLVSSRPIEADFSLQLNATSPLPSEIRQMSHR